MINLCIDVGNNATKVAIFENDTLKLLKSYTQFGLFDIEPLLQAFHFENSIISDVAFYDVVIDSFLSQHSHFIKLSPTTPLPITLNYETPETLGKDRIANAVAATTLYPGKNILVVDAGTSINYDFISSDKVFLGGSISPGFTMRLNALHHFTARLPLLNKTPINYIIGKNTNENIMSGVINGTIGEVVYFIEQYRKLYPDLYVILTGGDASFFENRTNCKIFAIPNLVLIGLNQIIHHHVA